MADYFDLGGYGRPVTTSSAQAQTWFDRGLLWSYAFNHEEAVRCFERAIEADPDCAMAHWGLAYALGPNYNKPWDAFEPDELTDAVSRAFHAPSAAASEWRAERGPGRAGADRRAGAPLPVGRAGRGLLALERRVRRRHARRSTGRSATTSTSPRCSPRR